MATDLEMTKLCAEAMGLTVAEQLGALRFPNTSFEDSLYDPLHDDAQCFALEGWLLERGNLCFIDGKAEFTAHDASEAHWGRYGASYRKRFLVECVVKMQAAVSSGGQDA